MRAELDDQLRIALPDAGKHLAGEPEAFVTLFKRGGLAVELFAPHAVDTQQPHEQDEICIVAAGTVARNARPLIFRGLLGCAPGWWRVNAAARAAFGAQAAAAARPTTQGAARMKDE